MRRVRVAIAQWRPRNGGDGIDGGCAAAAQRRDRGGGGRGGGAAAGAARRPASNLFFYLVTGQLPTPHIEASSVSLFYTLPDSKVMHSTQNSCAARQPTAPGQVPFGGVARARLHATVRLRTCTTRYCVVKAHARRRKHTLRDKTGHVGKHLGRPADTLKAGAPGPSQTVCALVVEAVGKERGVRRCIASTDGDCGRRDLRAGAIASGVNVNLERRAVLAPGGGTASPL